MSLLVNVVSCSGERFTDKRSVYCEVRVDTETVRTKSRKGNATWDQEFYFENLPAMKNIQLRCVRRRSGRVIGRTKIPLPPGDSRYQVKKILKVHEKGTVVVRMKWVKSPPPMEKKESKPKRRKKKTTAVEPAVRRMSRRLTEGKAVELQPLGGATQSHRVFGASLAQVMDKQKSTHPDLPVPEFIDVASRIIREHKSCQGIFRIRGRIADVKGLKSQIDSGEPIDEANVNIHLITTLVKAFLRELPVPILLFENYDTFMAIGKRVKDQNERILKLSQFVQKLPEHNYQLMKFLFNMLYDLSLQESETQMNAESLAKIFAPNLIWKKELDVTDSSMFEDSLVGIDLTMLFVSHAEMIFVR